MARLNPSLHESLTEDVLNNLFAKKIFTVINFLNADAKIVTKITNLTYKETIEIRKQILKNYSAKVNVGSTFYNNLLQNTSLIPTNIKSFDTLIGGGLMSGNIYEICGFAGSGKTQICLTIALNISQNLQKEVFYIDTKRDFTATKLQNMLDARKCSEETSGKILDRIKVSQISDQYQLIGVLYEIKNNLSNNANYPVVIIDSLPAVFYHNGNYNSTLVVMNHFANIIRYLSIEHFMSFVLVNIMIKEYLNNVNELANVIDKPGLGKYWENIPSTRVLMTKIDSSDDCEAAILKSTGVKCNLKCSVKITEAGVQ